MLVPILLTPYENNSTLSAPHSTLKFPPQGIVHQRQRFHRLQGLYRSAHAEIAPFVGNVIFQGAVQVLRAAGIVHHQRDGADKALAAFKDVAPGVALFVKLQPVVALHPAGNPGVVAGGEVDAQLCGLRRRGYTPKSIRNFCERVGVAKSPNTIPYAFLEFCLREDLNETAQRVMAVLEPIKLTITNYPEGQSETVVVENNPNRPEDGSREVSFSRNLWIEADDFLAQPVPKYKRLYPEGPECRLKGAYLIKCTGYVTDEEGNVTEVLATYDPESRGGDPADGRKVKGATIHWVDAATAVDAEVRQYDNLFLDADPDAAGKDYLACLNPNSLEVLTGCKVEAGLKTSDAPSYQFMRLGYFCKDSKDSSEDHLVFNRSVSLKDSFKPTV